MTDAPTPSEIGKEAKEGNEPTSLGDVARGNQDPSLSQDEDVPEDGGHIQEES